MYDRTRVQTLYNRRRRLTRALADFDRRAKVIRAGLAEVEAELQTLILFVPPLVTRGPRVVLSRSIVDFLREAGAPQTTREVMLAIVAAKDLPANDPRELRLLQNRVWIALKRLETRGLVRAEAESRRVVRWRLANL